MLFCLAAGKLTAVNAQIRLVTGLTTAALYIRHWPVISRLWSNLLARIQQKTNLQQGPNSVKKNLKSCAYKLLNLDVRKSSKNLIATNYVPV